MEILRDKVAVITGAASGIGRPIACALAELTNRGGAALSQRADVSESGLPEDIPATEWQRD
ncbi:MAG: hypothetical protein ACXVX7_05670 [Mycobacterium sp.]